MECPKCGNEVKDTDKVCPFCKKVLLLECPVCHKMNRTPVCEECGHVIIVKCHNCGTIGPNTLGKCRKCGFDSQKSVIMNEAETEEYACLAITFPNLEDLRPALKNKTIFNKFKKKLKQALFGYAKNQDNRAQRFGETYVIKYYKEFSLTSSVKKAVKSAIELLNKIGGISYKLKKSKNVRLHCKMTILKKSFDTDNNEFNTGLNIKLIKDNTEEKYTDGLQLITDQYVNNIISREYTLEMIYSSQVGDELLMFYEFPLEDQIIPIVEEEKPQENSILKGPKELPKLKIYDDDDELNEVLYGNKAIDISTEGRFISVPAHDIFHSLDTLLKEKVFLALKTTERRDLPTKDLLYFLKQKKGNVFHVVCKQDYIFKPYAFFRALIARILGLDLKSMSVLNTIKPKLKNIDTDDMLYNLLTDKPNEEWDADTAYAKYSEKLRELLNKYKGATIFIENFDIIDETSLKIIGDYIETLINIEDLSLSFVVTVRSNYSVYKNIAKLLHSPFYREINVTKGDYDAFLQTIPENIEEIKNSFYMKKLEERCAGSFLYFQNAINYMKDTNIFITFEGKLMINAEKTIVFPVTMKELLTKRFETLPENEGLIVAYTLFMEGHAHINLLEKLNIQNLPDAINSLVAKNLIIVEDNIVLIQNSRLFKDSIDKALAPEVKETLARNIVDAKLFKNFNLLSILKQRKQKIGMIYQYAINALKFGDFDAYLNCSKYYFKLLEEMKVKEGEAYERKGELYSYLIDHLNRYPSTKVYSIARIILANATKNNDDETIVNVSNLILDSALSGHDYILASQCMQNILTRILNPVLVSEGQDYTPQFVLYSCINAKIVFSISRYTECLTVSDKIIELVTPEFIQMMESRGVERNQFVSYVMETLVYSALSRIIMCDGTLEGFLENVKEHLGSDILSREHLIMLDKLLHCEEFDVDAGLSNDALSIFITNLVQAFKNFKNDYNEFAQNIYKAKQSLQNEDMKLLSLICDLFIGYSYQKINLERQVSWKKCETIYEDVYRIAQRCGFNNLIYLTSWFRASLLKDKGLFEEAYDLVISITASLKRSNSKNRLLVLINYILTANILANIEERKSELPIVMYRIGYYANKYNFDAYYDFIEDERLLDAEYLNSLEPVSVKEDVAKFEQEVAEAEQQNENVEELQKIEGNVEDLGLDDKIPQE